MQKIQGCNFMRSEAGAHKKARKVIGESRPSQPIHFIRLSNLEGLIEKRFDGKAARLAKQIGRSHTYLWQLLHKYRAIGEVTARHIEKRLTLGERELDKKMGAFEKTTMLTQHLGDGHTRNYRMVPQVTLADFCGTPSRKAEDLRPCPLGGERGPQHLQCSEATVWFKAEISMEPRIKLHEMVFADRKVKSVEDGALYVVKPKGMRRSRQHIVREARRTEDGFVFRALKMNGDEQKSFAAADVLVCGRIFYAAREV